LSLLLYIIIFCLIFEPHIHAPFSRLAYLQNINLRFKDKINQINPSQSKSQIDDKKKKKKMPYTTVQQWLEVELFLGRFLAQ